jgi:hypothetical protein
MNHNDKFFKRLANETNSFFEKHPDLIITESDKGKTTVILNKANYESAILVMLENKCDYIEYRRDPTHEVHKKLGQLLDKIQAKEYLNDVEKEKLTMKHPTAPKIYALPKVHKKIFNERGELDIKFRPITSFLGSPLYFVSKFLSNILNEHNKNNDYTIYNSLEFKQKIVEIKVPENHIMISLDVINLFPNIPNNLVIRTIDDRWKKIKQHTNLTKALFLDLISHCINNSYCQYKGRFFKQIKGLPMG